MLKYFTPIKGFKLKITTQQQAKNYSLFMKGKHATQKRGLNSASQKLKTLVEMSISSNNNFV